MVMTSTHDIDAEKQRYASELAEYTRRQWDMARRSLELAQSQPKDRSSPKGGRSPGRDSQSSAGGRVSQGGWPALVSGKSVADECAGIQSHDYAHRSHMRGGGIAHENRAVAAQ